MGWDGRAWAGRAGMGGLGLGGLALGWPWAGLAGISQTQLALPLISKDPARLTRLLTQR
jgi:hypothetical protein